MTGPTVRPSEHAKQAVGVDGAPAHPIGVPHVRAFFDARSGTFSYLVCDPQSATCALIDPVLGYDQASGRTSTEGLEAILAVISAEKRTCAWILETHVHADHLTAATQAKAALGAQIVIGAGVSQVHTLFAASFGFAPEEVAAHAAFDRLVHDGESLALGSVQIEVLATPGHTPACVSYRCGDAVFVGDTVFQPDLGAGRCDFPGGDARALYRSVQRLYALPDDTRIFVCHDYPEDPDTGGRAQVGLADMRAQNVLINSAIDEAGFVAKRTARDHTLSTPTLMWPAVQVNMFGGLAVEGVRGGFARSAVRIPLDAI